MDAEPKAIMDQVVGMVSAANQLMEENRYEEAFDLANDMLATFQDAGDVPSGALGFAVLKAAEAIWRGYDYYSGSWGQTFDGIEQAIKWAGILPGGHDAARSAVELLPGQPNAEELLSYYESDASRYDVFRTGKLPENIPPACFLELMHQVHHSLQTKTVSGYREALETADVCLAIAKSIGPCGREGTVRLLIASSTLAGYRTALSLAAKAQYEASDRVLDLCGYFQSRMDRGQGEAKEAARLLPGDRRALGLVSEYEELRERLLGRF